VIAFNFFHVIKMENIKQDLMFSPAVVVEGSVLWNITPYSPLEDNRRFGGKCLPCYLLCDGFLIALFFSPEYGSHMVLRNVG
jgi:hypothetical protein